MTPTKQNPEAFGSTTTKNKQNKTKQEKQQNKKSTFNYTDVSLSNNLPVNTSSDLIFRSH